ncbi:transcription factor mef2A isoform X2 [Anopheles arabiensis]|uniref:transcription factor mef2A isoform X2 n=1 Tax=Anopheles arabiensis TaxID=7173 RepID=UPI001AAD56E5|nr:transcription factor mef2A isoform X2 [Anopheles arabiensis]
MSTAMSTAFMVDSLLQGKDSPSDHGSSPVHATPGVTHGDAGSLASISDSDEFDEPKDSSSLCDSPKSFHSLHHPASEHQLQLHHHHLHHHHHHHALLVQQQQQQQHQQHHHNSSSFSDDELPAAGPPVSLSAGVRRPGATFRPHPDPDGVAALEPMDFVCAKCGHCQVDLNPAAARDGSPMVVGGDGGGDKRAGENNNNHSKEEEECDSVVAERRGGDGDGIGSEYEFRCEKCGFGEYVVPGKQTILKESSKPVLKFSVSAILGDRKECVKVRNEFIQPQHLWPYIQQNLIQQNHLANPVFLGAHPHHPHHPHQQLPPHHHHPHHHPHHHHPHHHHHQPGTHPLSPHQQQQQHLTVGPNGSPTGGHVTNNSSSNSSGGPHHHLHNSNSSNSTSESGSLPNSPELQEPSATGLGPRDNKIIAKPLPSRPTPFLHHSLNHPHLHSLLAHCRNPYMPGGPQVFPLPPGQGFPWAHSTRGKPRRGMMRRAVFSDSQRKGLEKRFQLQKYISKPDRKKLAERLGLKDSQKTEFSSLKSTLATGKGELEKRKMACLYTVPELSATTPTPPEDRGRKQRERDGKDMVSEPSHEVAQLEGARAARERWLPRPNAPEQEQPQPGPVGRPHRPANVALTASPRITPARINATRWPTTTTTHNPVGLSQTGPNGSPTAGRSTTTTATADAYLQVQV